MNTRGWFMRNRYGLQAIAFALCVAGFSCIMIPGVPLGPSPDDTTLQNALDMIDTGRDVFRNDTFGSEAFYGDVLELHKAISGEANGGVAAGIDPTTALSLGLKVDVDALPESVRNGITDGTVDLSSPATTLALLQLDSVVGLKGVFDDANTLVSVGIQCALCHSSVDDSFAPGIGHRLDGWANRDLNVGAIISASPNLDPIATRLNVDVDTVRTVLASWGPGKFDASLLIDGKAFRPDGGAAAVLIPPAYGLAGVNLATWTGWGSVPYWNAFVANHEMNGLGTFVDSRLDDAAQFPVAAAHQSDDVRHDPDQITSKLPALHFYQLALAAPMPPAGSFDPAAAMRGEALFNAKARCSECHVPPLYTEPGFNLHTPDEIGIDSFQADRSPTGGYRTAPLRGLWAHQDGGFYHDGRFPTLLDVVDHYDSHMRLELSTEEKADLCEFLKSI